MRRRVGSRLAVAVGALVVALGVPVGASGIHEACAGAATGPTAAVVVDFGDVSGQGTPPGGVVSRCVAVTSGLTGAQALKNAGFELRLENGLLCAIDGYPANGCGEKTGDRKYLYWAYWRADATSGGWGYSSIGPGGARVAEGDIEGWRFVEGAGSPSDPQPGRAPDHDAICGVTTAPDSPTAPVAPRGVAPDAPNAVAPSASSPPFAVDPAAPVDPAAGGSTTSVIGPSSSADDPDSAGNEVALASATPASTRSNAGNILGVIVVAVVIVALGAAAFVRSRRTGTG